MPTLAAIFDGMVKQKVYFQAGLFPISNTLRCREAPFDLVTIPALINELFVQPNSQINAHDTKWLNVTGFTDGQDEAICMFGEGFDPRVSLVLSGDHELGAYRTDETWKGVHKFGWI